MSGYGRCMWHSFSRETHRCTKCDRWAPGFAPKKAHVKPRAECQVCERQQALATRTGEKFSGCGGCESQGKGVLGHHGYRRPGWGEIDGDCFGVGHAPFPATDALELWAASLKSQDASLVAAIANAPELQEIRKTLSRWNKETRRQESFVHVVKRGDEANHVIGVSCWEDVLYYHVAALESRLRLVRLEAKRVAARLALAQDIQAGRKTLKKKPTRTADPAPAKTEPAPETPKPAQPARVSKVKKEPVVCLFCGPFKGDSRLAQGGKVATCTKHEGKTL